MASGAVVTDGAALFNAIASCEKQTEQTERMEAFQNACRLPPRPAPRAARGGVSAADRLRRRHQRAARWAGIGWLVSWLAGWLVGWLAGRY